MRCSGCGEDIPFAGDVCPYCLRDKSEDQQYTVVASILGAALAYVGYLMFELVGAIAGFVVGGIIAVFVTRAGGKTDAPEVAIVNEKNKGEGDCTERRLKKLDDLKQKGLITDDEFSERRSKILEEL
jgi:hypothetical protein